jgi:hypothetical protein
MFISGALDTNRPGREGTDLGRNAFSGTSPKTPPARYAGYPGALAGSLFVSIIHVVPETVFLCVPGPRRAERTHVNPP